MTALRTGETVKRSISIAAFLLLTVSAAAHPGVGIVMDSRGNVFYTDLSQVWKVSPDGTKTVAVPGVHTHELFLDTADNLFGEHLWYEGDATGKWGHRVWRLSPDGAVADVIPARAGFRDDYQDFSFVRDRAGNMYWAARGKETVIRRRAPDGTVADFSRNAAFQDVRWMTASPDGIVYLIDGPDLREVAPDGTVTTRARDLKERSVTQITVGESHVLMGVWVDGRKNVYVAGYGARVVKKVTPDGRVSVVARTPFPWSPTGGMVAPNGDLWLLETSTTNRVRVQRITSDGRTHTY
jgi:hypothetical protein